MQGHVDEPEAVKRPALGPVPDDDAVQVDGVDRKAALVVAPVLLAHHARYRDQQGARDVLQRAWGAKRGTKGERVRELTFSTV